MSQRSVLLSGALGFGLAVSAGAAVAWTRAPAYVVRPAPSIRIVDVRPLQTSDSTLRDIITHTFAVRVAISGWTLLPYEPDATANDNHAGAGHWRLYLDGRSLGDNFGNEKLSYTPYLSAGTHWIAAELSNGDYTSVDPPIWSEPVVLHVPAVIRCWQTGWRGSSRTGRPTFKCNPRRGPRRVAA
jgi:hypothetical protein